MFSRALRGAGIAGCAGIAGLFLVTDPLQRDALVRFARTAYVGSRIAMEYKYTVGPVEAAHGTGSAEYAAARHAVDLNSATALLELCRLHGGLFTKLGQYVSTLNHALPVEYTATLAAVQDRAPSRPWSEVQVVLERELGPARGRLVRVDPQPIAAASLAQVHKGVLDDGSHVAVKVQYPDLERVMLTDLEGIRILLSLVSLIWPDYAYSWLLPEFESSLRNELNFNQEAANAERVAAMFASNPRVHVPRIHADLSTRRVLVMEFIDGVKVSDHAGMAAMGVPEPALASTISRVFGDMIHVHGFVHCDPHPGNLFVRVNPTGQWQLVVLDHGMYRRLTPHFRAAYCRLWKALVMRDDDLGRTATRELGLEAVHYDALSLALTYRPAASSAGLGKRMSGADVARIKAEYGSVTAGDINRFMQRLPRDMLFVMRSSNMIRALNMDLGGTSRQRFQIMAESAIRGLTLTDAVGDFQASAEAHLAAAGEGGGAVLVGAAPAVSDAPSIFRFLAQLRATPPVEPVTYVNALSSGSVLSTPTESEAQRHLTGSWWRQVRLWWGLVDLRVTLWWLDALFALLSWRGEYTPHESQQHAAAVGTTRARRDVG